MPRVDDEEKGGRGCRAWTIEEKWATGGDERIFFRNNILVPAKRTAGLLVLLLILSSFFYETPRATIFGAFSFILTSTKARYHTKSDQ